jgi:hypothetical protein
VKGQLDLAVLAWPITPPELSGVELFSEDLVVIVDRDHELARHCRSRSRFATLAEYEILLPLPRHADPTRDRRGEPLQGVELQPLIELDGLRTIASMTFDGYGPSILPATMLSKHLRDKFVARTSTRSPAPRLSRESALRFPAAPVRAIHALLIDVVSHAVNVPDGVYLEEDIPLSRVQTCQWPRIPAEVAAFIARRDRAFPDHRPRRPPPRVDAPRPSTTGSRPWSARSPSNCSRPRPPPRSTDASSNACGGVVNVDSIINAGVERLRAAGLSRTKAQAMVDLATTCATSASTCRATGA